MNVLNKKYTNPDYLRLLSLKLHSQSPVEYIIMDDFLDTDFYRLLIHEIRSFSGAPRGDTHGRQIYQVWWRASREFWRNHTGKAMRDFLAYFFDRDVYPEWRQGSKGILHTLLNKIPWIQSLALRKNIPGSFLDWHTDGPATDIAGSIVLYFNDSWKDGDGWELEFGKKVPSGEIIPYISVPPLWNRCVLFVCQENQSWHRVLPVAEWWERVFIHDQIMFAK